MTETIKLPDYYSPDGRNARYGSLEELKELLLYKRIVKWDKDFLLLEDGTKATIEMSESDCCAWAGGEFRNVTLDAVITDVKIGERETEESDWGETTSRNKVTIYHNQTKPFQILVNMHQFGYEVEKEKRYFVSIKGVSSNICYLNRVGNKWIIAGINEHTGMNIYTKHTKKQLEDANFGWVFDCPGVEVREVEEW